MIAILDNLISLSMLPIGFALDHIVLLLKAPFGFVAVFSSVTYFEYSTAKSIIKDIKAVNLKKIEKHQECNILTSATASCV